MGLLRPYLYLVDDEPLVKVSKIRLTQIYEWTK
jgi:hypothetical protein